MKILLIGMSGSGKSYWSKKLETIGFKRFCCDDLIEEKLAVELKSLGYCGIQDVAKWMGQPFEKRYKNNSQKYLKFEIEVMKELLSYLKQSKTDENIVIDTTGSVIYTGEQILSKLKDLSKIAYLHTPSFVREQMYQEYIKNPKPVFWGKAFSKNKGENDRDALKRCYPGFLEFRVKKYKELSEIIFDYHLLRHEIFDINIFSEIIRKYD